MGLKQIESLNYYNDTVEVNIKPGSQRFNAFWGLEHITTSGGTKTYRNAKLSIVQIVLGVKAWTIDVSYVVRG